MLRRLQPISLISNGFQGVTAFPCDMPCNMISAVSSASRAIPMSVLEYRDIEARLAELHSIHEEDLGAFRARIRVLRNMGVPDLPRVGKGARVGFSPDDIAELHLVLTLGEFGLPPARIVQIITKVKGLSQWPLRRPHAAWLVVSLRADPEYPDEPVLEGELLRVVIVKEADLLDHIKERRLNKVATWHGVFDLELFASDLENIR
jgi:hypothetical protein